MHKKQDKPKLDATGDDGHADPVPATADTDTGGEKRVGAPQNNQHRTVHGMNRSKKRSRAAVQDRYDEQGRAYARKLFKAAGIPGDPRQESLAEIESACRRSKARCDLRGWFDASGEQKMAATSYYELIRRKDAILSELSKLGQPGNAPDVEYVCVWSHADDGVPADYMTLNEMAASQPVTTTTVTPVSGDEISDDPGQRRDGDRATTGRTATAKARHAALLDEATDQPLPPKPAAAVIEISDRLDGKRRRRSNNANPATMEF